VDVGLADLLSALLLRSPDFGRPTSGSAVLRVWAASVGASTFCLAGFCFGLGIAGSCAARRCSGCGEVNDSWAGAVRSRSGVGSGTAPNPNSRLWTSSAWAENSLSCFHQKLACSFAISNGSLALAKLLARSRPASKFLWVVRMIWRFTASALWFAASKNFLKKCIVARTRTTRHLLTF